jgi:hypothetical protein
MNMRTPWGIAQQHTVIAGGITKFDTASHGGIKISQKRRNSMPDKYRNIPTFTGGNWYEEDCDWCLVALSFPEHFDNDTLNAANNTYIWLQKNSDRVHANQEQKT